MTPRNQSWYLFCILLGVAIGASLQYLDALHKIRVMEYRLNHDPWLREQVLNEARKAPNSPKDASE